MGKLASVWSMMHMVPPLSPERAFIPPTIHEEKKRVNFPYEMTNAACCERGTNILYLKGDSGSSLSFPFSIISIISWLSLAEKKCELMKVEKDECNLIPQVR